MKRSVSLPVLGLFGHLTVERQGEAAQKHGRFTGEHEVYLGPVTVYWSAPFEGGMDETKRRQVVVTLSSLHLPLMPYAYLKVDSLVKCEVDR